jgi:hypothetical protein
MNNIIENLRHELIKNADEKRKLQCPEPYLDMQSRKCRLN